jgi:hypothetical protein
MMAKSIKITVVVVVFSVFSGAVHSSIIHRPNDHPTIQEAINAAVNGDTDLVAPRWNEGDANAEALVASSWWTEVQNNILAQEYTLKRLKQDGTLQAVNRPANLKANFRESGIELVPRIGSSNWHCCFRFMHFGREGESMQVGFVEPKAKERRVEYLHPNITEWYVNRKEGIEQGFILHKRPEGTGSLVIQGRLSGNLKPQLTEDGQKVSFLHEGEEVLSYGHLLVKDADGKALPARLAVEENTLAILIEKEGRYPIYIDPLFTTPSWTAESDQEGAEFGWSVASAGDVNNDEYDDVIVGAQSYQYTQPDEGRAYVFHGSPSGLSTTPDWVANGNQAYVYFGGSVACAGDVNNDGYADVIIGAKWFDSVQEDEGRAFVYHGSSSGLSTTPDWTAESNQAHSYFGISVESAGDVNDDGYDDVIVGASWFDSGQEDEGRAFVYHGSSSGLSSIPNWTAECNATNAHFGHSVASAGDVNDDGYADVIVGAHFYDNLGRVYVYHGSSYGLSFTPDWIVQGDDFNAYFGCSVASAGNVNGDSFDDVIVGASSYESSYSTEGRAYIFHGSSSGLSTTPDWTVDGNQDYASLGWCVSSAGDLNLDGYSDVIVGVPGFENGEENEGCAHVFCGSDTGLSSTPETTLEINQVDAVFGWFVASAGDVNRDGYPDIIVGSPLYDNGEEDEGSAFLYQILTTTCQGGSQSGTKVRETFELTQDSYDEATDLYFTLQTDAYVNGWKAKIFSFSDSECWKDGDYSVDFHAYGANVKRDAVVKVEGTLWQKQWNAMEICNVAWEGSKQTQAIADHKWTIGFPWEEPLLPGTYLHTLTITNTDPSSSIDFTEFEYTFTMDYIENLQSINFSYPAPDFSLDPGDSWSIDISTGTDPFYEGHIYFKYGIKRDTGNVVFRGWADHPVIPYVIDDTDDQFFTFRGSDWNEINIAGAWDGSTHFRPPGTGGNWVAWRVDQLVEPGNYDVYAWKFEHPYSALMATNAQYMVKDKYGLSGWIFKDQSTAGDEWLYLGNFDFDNGSMQGIALTDNANGFVIADAIKFVNTP